MTITLHPWTSRDGQIRHYVDRDDLHRLIGLEVSYYRTGSVCWAYLGDEKISNVEAGHLLGVRVWLDEDMQPHVDHKAGRPRVLTDTQIAATVAAALIKEDSR